MSSADLVSQATAELYGTDLDAFTKRRTELAAQARAAGDRAAAKQIADLRKPTRSAWVVNQLIRADPTVASQLAALTAEFRAGQAAADRTALRRASQRRAALIDSLVRQAFEIAAEGEPSATLREEVTSTLAAALADPQIAAKLAAGTLTRAEQQAGFGSLADGLAQPSPERGQAPDATARTPDAARTPDTTAQAADAVRAARAERQRQQAIANAEQAVENAHQAADAAAAAEREQEQAVRLLEEELAQARLRLQQARLFTRQATNVHANATRALRRLRGAPHDHERFGAADDAFPS